MIENIIILSFILRDPENNFHSPFFIAPPRIQALSKNRDHQNGTGAAIRTYALQLAADKTTTFSQNIDNFIQCTRESKEVTPHVVMRNMRQFMSGMKNYLVKHGEREFEKEVEKERLKLRPNEFLNLDAILEDVMMGLVVRPLREHVCRLFIDYYVATGVLQTLAENIQHAQGKTIHDLGVRVSKSRIYCIYIINCIKRYNKDITNITLSKDITKRIKFQNTEYITLYEINQIFITLKIKKSTHLYLLLFIILYHIY